METGEALMTFLEITFVRTFGQNLSWHRVLMINSDQTVLENPPSSKLVKYHDPVYPQNPYIPFSNVLYFKSKYHTTPSDS